ncbi:MAG: VanW family protein [Defluviitaleaceae bacterium]|nr:VanW family protein [Defluviitaleaceae bacterium]
MPQPQKNKNKKIKKTKKSWKTAMFLGLVVLMSAVGITVAAALGAPAMIVDMMNPPPPPVMEVVETYTIADNVYIDGIRVTGLTQDEALQLLNREIRDVELTEEINLVHNDYIFTYTLADFNASHDFQAAIDFAYSIGRGRESSGIVELESAFYFDSDAVSDIMARLVNELNRESRDASMFRENGEFIITPEIVGFEVNQHRLVDDLVNAVRARRSTDIVIEVLESVPELTEVIFERSTDKLGTFYTIITGNDPGRNQNLYNASSKINNYIVLPGEVFSTNRAFGAMTYENGYRLAPVIVNGELVPGMGGGICQISTNLYIAVVFAELRIVERLNHSMRVGYADYGWDATLAGDIIDLRFENDTDYPILIEAYIYENRAYVHIFGHESRAPGRRLELFSRVIERIPAPEDTIIEDSTMEPGERRVVSPARGGVVAELIKIVFDGDMELYRERVNTSRYRARGAIVRVGPGYEGKPLPEESYEVNPDEGTDAVLDSPYIISGGTPTAPDVLPEVPPLSPESPARNQEPRQYRPPDFNPLPPIIEDDDRPPVIE